MKRIIVGGVLILFSLCGCTQRNDITMVKEILALAKEDKVEGKVKFHINGRVESGMKEGIYFGSPSSVVEAELEFKVRDIKENPEQTTEYSDTQGVKGQ